MVDLIPATPLDDPPALLFYAFRRLTEEPDRILALRGLATASGR